MVEQRFQQRCEVGWMSPMSSLILVPLIPCFIAGSGFAATYWLSSIHTNHTPLFMPMISQTGRELPESAVFAWVMNLVAFSAFVMVVLKYLYFSQQFCSFQARHKNARILCILLRVLNALSSILGLISAFALTVTGSFPADSIVNAVHMVGALSFFIGVTIYFGLITLLTIVRIVMDIHDTPPKHRTLIRLSFIMLGIVRVLIFIALFVCFSGYAIYFSRFSMTWRTDVRTAMVYFTRAAVAEWLFVGVIGLFWASWIFELATFRLSLSLKEIRFVNK